MLFRESNINDLNKEKESSKTMILKNHKFNIMRTQSYNLYSSTKILIQIIIKQLYH